MEEQTAVVSPGGLQSFFWHESLGKCQVLPNTFFGCKSSHASLHSATAWPLFKELFSLSLSYASLNIVSELKFVNILNAFFHMHIMYLNIIKVFFFTNWYVNCLKNNFKIHIKIDIKTAPTCFGIITIIRERTIWAC